MKANKTDAHEAAAICEAVTRPSMRFVSLNTPAQQDLQMLHRIRTRLVASRTALLNQIRGLVGEYGIVFRVGPAAVRHGLTELLARPEPGLSSLAQELLSDLQGQLRELDERIGPYDARVKRACASDACSRKLITLPGIGALTATARVAAINEGKQFRSGRHLAANLGLTPYEHSSGGKHRLLGISKRGNRYVRPWLIQGARTLLRHASAKPDPLSRWVVGIAARRGANVAAVALANKRARIAWAVLAGARTYQAQGSGPRPLAPAC